MKWAIDLAERGMVPDGLIRWGIRRLNQQRLCMEETGNAEKQQETLRQFIAELRQSPIAVETVKANVQHYELPPAFFQHALGIRLKYSGCYWPPGVSSLNEAEEAMLALTCQRAEITDGQDILELGCGWGSLSIWLAETYPKSRIVAVSNSQLQREFIQAACQRRGLTNIDVLTQDMNHLDLNRQFDRVVSVEMFEHMRNWELLLARIATWLKPEGKLFIHIFTHRRFAYLYDVEGDANWMGRYFFTGGMMPADNMLLNFQNDLTVEDHWCVNGTHYQKTAEAWLENMDKHRHAILPVMADVYGRKEAARWFQRWRIFFMACSELWGYQQGQEWIVSHYRLQKC